MNGLSPKFISVKFQKFVSCLLALLLASACTRSVLSPADKTILEEAQHKYRGTADISFRSPFYVVIQGKSVSVSSGTAVQILKDLAFVGRKTEIERPDTPFIYAEAQEGNGRALYTVFWDPQRREFGYQDGEVFE